MRAGPAGLPAVMVVLLLLVGGVLADRPAVAREDDPECARWRKVFVAMPSGTLVVERTGKPPIRIPVKVAATDEARWAGFQCATVGEIRTTVILFDFGAEVLGSFHMRNVPAPLDIAFVKASGRVFSVLRMDPSPTREYGPMGAYRYAIEAGAGFFKDKGIAPGHRVQLDEGSR